MLLKSINMILAEVTYITVGTGVSAGEYVRVALDFFKKSGIRYYPNSMSTVLEANTMDEIFDIVKGAENELIEKGVRRVETLIKIDHRVDIENTVERKLKAIGL